MPAETEEDDEEEDVEMWLASFSRFSAVTAKIREEVEWLEKRA
jgi:hypothetical protein